MFNYLYRKFFPSKANTTDNGSHEYYYPIGEIDSDTNAAERFNQMADVIEDHFDVERGTEEFMEAALNCSLGIPANELNNVSCGTGNPDDLVNYEETWY